MQFENIDITFYICLLCVLLTVYKYNNRNLAAALH